MAFIWCQLCLVCCLASLLYPTASSSFSKALQLVLVFSLAVWIFFPFLRRRSSFVVVVYLYSYFVYWRVFKDSIFGVKYSDYLFFRLMFAFGFVLWIAPFLGALQQRLVYLFNRWVKKSTLFAFSSFMKG